MKSKFLSRILLFFIFAVTAFIFINSMQPSEISGNMSGKLLILINRLLNMLHLSSFADFSEYMLRKAAHILEFTVQSVFMCTYALSRRKRYGSFIIYILFLGLFTACTDEFIQLFSIGRSSMIQDVFVDFSGTISGIIISLFFRRCF